MINEIIRQLENSEGLLRAVHSLTLSAYDEQELAEAIREWFEDNYIESVVVEPTSNKETSLDLQIAGLFETILDQALNSITSEQWLAIASHFWSKSRDGKGA